MTTEGGTFSLERIPRDGEGIDKDGQYTTYEKAELLESKHRVLLDVAVKLRTGAIFISWVSVIVGFAQGVTAIVFALRLSSTTIFGFGLNSILDSTSSLVVLWRFYSKEVYSEKRELRACFVIAILFIISGICTVTMTAVTLAEEKKESQVNTLWTLAIVNGLCNVLLGILKVVIGYKLESKSLMTDSVITFIGAVMSFSAFLATELYENNPSLWYIDSVFGFGCSLFLFLFAIKLFWQSCRKGIIC